MLEIFCTDGKELCELREFYFKKNILPEMKAENKKWNPKTIEEAYEILKNYFKKEKSSLPNFFKEGDTEKETTE